MNNDVNVNDEKSKEVVINTSGDAHNGQNKCPKCGSTDISVNISSGKLRCNFCRNEFEPEKVSGMVSDLTKLEGRVVGSGATDIVADTNDIMTFKCSSCGAEVVVDTSSSAQARCHWCRNILSVNEQIPNGSIPDVILPFKISKEEAQLQIQKFVNKRKFYANSQFKKEFKTDNIMGVYLPYMLVDANLHANFSGSGEHQLRSYTVGSDKSSRTVYDAEVYHVEREFDLTVEDLSVESNSDKLNTTSSNTNNVINAIMPFDTENCVKFNANYLRGFTSEKRDVNIDNLNDTVKTQMKDVARFAANDTLDYYDRGVAWQKEDASFKGEQWEAAYLPVWLYSYLQVKGSKKVLHYVAVNARTKETMGSVPINTAKLFIMSLIVEILGVLAMLNTDFNANWLFLTVGFIYYIVMYLKYRNSNARHTYEKDTKTSMTNLRQVDDYIKTNKGVDNFKIEGCNNTNVSNQKLLNSMINSLKK